MDTLLFEKLLAEGLISADSYENVKTFERTKNYSVHWEIKTLLYLGVLLLTSGLGILVYKNIDTIGHQVILLFIALVCAASFFYCFKNKLPYAVTKVPAPNGFFDYVLLLACCTFISFIAYLQFQYNVFGNKYGAATFFPMVVLFLSAYYFDHLGILSLAITNLAAWLGLTITPLHILESNDFASSRIIITGLFLGALLIGTGWGTKLKNIKGHFAFTYTNFGLHILFISLLAAMFEFRLLYLAFFLLLLFTFYLFYLRALKERSFYYLVVSTLYAYIAMSYVFIDLLSRIGGYDMGPIYLGFLYFIASGIGLVLFLIKTNKKLKAL